MADEAPAAKDISPAPSIASERSRAVSDADFPSILEHIEAEIRPTLGTGPVESYIPALASVDKSGFAMAVACIDGQVYQCGDAEHAFSIQSISKVFALLQALDLIDPDELWRRVGREPSGTAFNSLIQLESEAGIPRNPFINSGAIVVTDVVTRHSVSPVLQILGLVRRFADNPKIYIDEDVARSERAHGDRNAAIAHLLKAQGNLNAPVADVLHAYFNQCSIAMSCVDLAKAFLPLANRGCQPGSETPLLPAARAKRINALMLTCGLYDGVGNFAYRVGIPAKSGVGGGIVGVVPGKCSIAVWSPELDELGNSRAGTAALEMLAHRAGLSIF